MWKCMFKIEELGSNWRPIVDLLQMVMVEVMLVQALHMYKEGYRSAGRLEIKFSMLKMYETQIKTIGLFSKDNANNYWEW